MACRAAQFEMFGVTVMRLAPIPGWSRPVSVNTGSGMVSLIVTGMSLVLDSRRIDGLELEHERLVARHPAGCIADR